MYICQMCARSVESPARFPHARFHTKPGHGKLRMAIFFDNRKMKKIHRMVAIFARTLWMTIPGFSPKFTFFLNVFHILFGGNSKPAPKKRPATIRQLSSHPGIIRQLSRHGSGGAGRPPGNGFPFGFCRFQLSINQSP